jgi:hypothetical protein
MNEKTFAQLSTVSSQLHSRVSELSRGENDRDIALLMSALAVTMDALASLSDGVTQLSGPSGLGGKGE